MNKVLNVIIERTNNNSYSAYIADDDCEFGCVGEGSTIEETKKDFLQCVDDVKAAYRIKNMNFPEVSFEFSFAKEINEVKLA